MLAAAKSILSTSLSKAIKFSMSKFIQVCNYTSQAMTIKDKLLDRYIRSKKVRKLLFIKVDPTIDNIKDALQGDIQSDLVTEEVLELCDKLEKEGKELPMPISNGPHVKDFSEVAGPENAKSALKKAGCYHLHSLNSDESYVGQSTVLGKRVKDHANGKNASTSQMVSNFGLNGRVTLYIVDPNVLPEYINLSDFLVILEQYLFFKLRPTVNKVLIASAGVMHSPTSILSHIAIVGKPLFVYFFLNGEYTLLHTFTNTSALGHLIGYGRKWPGRILGRGGFYRYALYLSEVPIENSNSQLITTEQLVAFIQWLTLQEEIAKGQAVKVTNSKSGSIQYYPNIKSAADSLSCDIASVKPNRSTPLKGLYYFSYITNSDYISAVMPNFFKYK